MSDWAYRLVMQQPIPDRLIDNLRLADLRPRRKQCLLTIRLTPQRYEVLKYLCRGFRDGEIADEMGISEWTVKQLVRELLALFDVRSRTVLVARCYREGVV